MKKLTLIAAVIILACFGSGIFAHPHIHIDSTIKLDYADGKCRGFWVD
ncbi:MAG: hypothetical protein JW982_07900 [Spirochaetes bacterium]|nr:hypothetical protein [Spirochaetota bacterium]